MPKSEAVNPEPVIRRELADLGYTCSAVHVAPHHGMPHWRVIVVQCSANGEARDSGDVFDTLILADPVLVRAWVQTVWEPLREV